MAAVRQIRQEFSSETPSAKIQMPEKHE